MSIIVRSNDALLATPAVIENVTASEGNES